MTFHNDSDDGGLGTDVRTDSHVTTKFLEINGLSIANFLRYGFRSFTFGVQGHR